VSIFTELQGFWYPCEHNTVSVINSYQLPGSRMHDLRKNRGTCKQNYWGQGGTGGQHTGTDMFWIYATSFFFQRKTFYGILEV